MNNLESGIGLDKWETKIGSAIGNNWGGRKDLALMNTWGSRDGLATWSWFRTGLISMVTGPMGFRLMGHGFLLPIRHG